MDGGKDLEVVVGIDVEVDDEEVVFVFLAVNLYGTKLVVVIFSAFDSESVALDFFGAGKNANNPEDPVDVLAFFFIPSSSSLSSSSPSPSFTAFGRSTTIFTGPSRFRFSVAVVFAVVAVGILADLLVSLESVSSRLSESDSESDP